MRAESIAECAIVAGAILGLWTVLHLNIAYHKRSETRVIVSCVTSGGEWRLGPHMTRTFECRRRDPLTGSERQGSPEDVN